MADIRLAVAFLPAYQQLVADALPHVVAAFSPFGVNFRPEVGGVLNRDPVDSAGWRQVMDALTRQSEAQSPPAPAHLVFAEVPPGFDRSINGQLLNRMRGICAVFLGAQSFQNPAPFERLDLVVQVSIHELGHLLNLTHSDSFRSGGYSDAVMPTRDRQQQSPAEAWASATSDAERRGEPAVAIPVPTLSYPFGRKCRECLREASTNSHWWPWRTAFKGDFDIPSETQDRSLRLAIRGNSQSGAIRADRGVDFTLEIYNDGNYPVPLPTHIGPEFGTLAVTSVDAAGQEHPFVPESYRCSSAKQAILPGATIRRSFSLIPGASQGFLRDDGQHILRVRLTGSEQGSRTLLGLAEINVDVRASSTPATSAAVAAELMGAARGSNALPPREAFASLNDLVPDSAMAHHTRYKLSLLHRGRERKRLLRECLGPTVPPAIRHRAGRQLVLDQLMEGRVESWPPAWLSRAFNRPEDAELFETLERMRDGWNALSPQAKLSSRS